VNPRESLDRAAFILAFIAGVGGGVFLKLLGVHPFITAAYAAVILIAYAVSAWLAGRLQIEPEAIGDNCYYLGFLFTLASLSYTLYQMSAPTGSNGKPIEIPDVISGFGVALSSTIVGVFLRVLMMQMRPDFVAQDRAVRADLNRSYGDFRKTLSGTLSQMKTFSTESIQFAAERDERLRVSTEKFVADHQAALLKTADVLSKNMETKFSEAAKTALNEIAEASLKTTLETQTAIRELVSEIQALKNNLMAQEAEAFEDIQLRRKRLTTELNAASKKMQEHDEAMSGYIKITRSASDAMSKRMMPALEAFTTHLNELPQDATFQAARPKVSDIDDAGSDLSGGFKFNRGKKGPDA
jgi:hypothetical protein